MKGAMSSSIEQGLFAPRQGWWKPHLGTIRVNFPNAPYSAAFSAAFGHHQSEAYLSIYQVTLYHSYLKITPSI
jgi:hypothetical protein